jgi:phosphoserine phosphatase
LSSLDEKPPQETCPRLRARFAIIAPFLKAAASMHLVIQGDDIETPDLKAIAKLAHAKAIEQIHPCAFRMRDAQPHDEVASACERAKLDYAYVPDGRRLSDYRLLVMDMDSTLITIETIDELADLQGLKSQVAEITAQAMRGEIEYDESLKRRVALLRGLDEKALDRVYDERLMLSPGAEKLLAAARAAGLKTLLVSGGFTCITDRLKPRLKLDYTRSNTLATDGGKLTGEVEGRIVNADVKRDELVRVRELVGASREQVIAIGDGANDLKFMAEAGVSIAYHAKPVVQSHATHALNYMGLDGVLPLFDAAR